MKTKLSFLAVLMYIVTLSQTAPAYYNTIDFSKTGSELKTQLETLIKNTHHTTISYGELPSLLKVSDADPQMPGNILLLYGSTSSGNHQRSRSAGATWNREHTYPKSLGTPNLGTTGPGADPHQIRPTDNQLNSERGSLKFADGTGATAYKTGGGWYPGDEWKGDVARILMYMYVRYQNRCQPINVALGSKTYSTEMVDVLLKWNIEDPVSDFEKQRNEEVYKKQGNRNPFIDNPYLATLIWGGDAAQNTWPDTFNGGQQDTEKPTQPTNVTSTEVSGTWATLTWNASTDNIAVAGYEVYVNGVFYGKVSTNSIKLIELQNKTSYTVTVQAYDAAGNKSEISQPHTFTTTSDATSPNNGEQCGYEDFENIPTDNTSAYTAREWTNNGITWFATDARVDRQITGKAITIRKGGLISSEISTGGIGTLTVTTKREFTGGTGTFTLKINGVEKGTIPYSNTETTTTIQDINVDGVFTITIEDNSANNRVSFDNLSWTCYSSAHTNDAEPKSAIRLKENPIRNGEIHLEGQNLSNIEKAELYNMNGQLLLSKNQPFKNTSVLKTKTLVKGIYLLKLDHQTLKVLVH